MADVHGATSAVVATCALLQLLEPHHYHSHPRTQQAMNAQGTYSRV